MNDKPLLTLEKISKSFGPVQVIHDVTVDVRPGKVQVLLGENGAGKSTLIKIMAGIYQPDGGRILLEGKPVKFKDINASEAAGIATIHQELNLFPSMTVAENIMMGRFPKRMGMVDRTALREKARAALAMIGLDVDLDHPVGELGIARQQLVEIARALSLDARMLILDEPTAALTHTEIGVLFEVIHTLRAQGVGMVFISHHLDEIAEVGDSVSVIRDGILVDEVPPTTTEPELVRLMVGRDISAQYPRKRSYSGAPVPLLEVKDLSIKGLITDVSLTLHAGEVVGLAGLMGAGRTEVMRAIAGADPRDSGSVKVRGRQIPQHSVRRAIGAGIGHVPEDRKVHGLVLDGSVNENIGYATLAATAKSGLVNFKRQRERAKSVAESLRIRMHDLDQSVRSLSGGNQQKVVFARWIVAGSEVLLLDEPTRGVDVGAKVEIYELINSVTEAGGAVLMISSELPEVLGMSDRVLVMSGGHLSGELSSDEATQDSIMNLAVRDVVRDLEDNN